MHILHLIRLRNNARRNWIRFRTIWHKRNAKFLSVLITDSINSFRNKNWNELLMGLDKSSPKFWHISKIIKKKSKTIPSLKCNDHLYTTNSQKAELIAQKFLLNHEIPSNASDAETVHAISLRSLKAQISHGSCPYVVCASDIKIIVKSPKNKESPGLDKISNFFLKALPQCGFDILARLYNACFSQSYFPLVWKMAKIIAFPKPVKNPSSPDSYRPISL